MDIDSSKSFYDDLLKESLNNLLKRSDYDSLTSKEKHQMLMSEFEKRYQEKKQNQHS